MKANIGGDDIRVETRGSREQHMRDFDQLPRQVRQYLAGMSIDWNGTAVREICLRHGPKMALRVLQRTEADMQAAYYDRIAA